MRAPLLDWLDLYGEERGYMSEKDGPEYDARLDFLPFIFKQGRAFEDGIFQLLQERYQVSVISHNGAEIRELAKPGSTEGRSYGSGTGNKGHGGAMVPVDFGQLVPGGYRSSWPHNWRC